MKATRAMAAAAIAAMTWAGAAVAQGPMGHGPGHGPRGGRGFGPEAMLDLTEAQREQMKALHEQRFEAMKPVMEEARAAREAFEKALEAEGADAQTVGEAALAMKAARDKMQAAHEATRKEVEKILTEEQRAKLEKLHAEGPRGRRGPHGPGAGPHHGGPFGPPPVEQ